MRNHTLLLITADKFIQLGDLGSGDRPGLQICNISFSHIPDETFEHQ